MGKSCADVLDVVPETVVLAFDIAGITDPADAARIAESREVQKAIEKALAAKGKELIQKHFKGKEITQDDALEMLKSAGSKLLDNRKKDLEKRLKCAYENSPLGVWIDKHSWVLYVFVPLLVGGAGTYLFVAKTGDWPAGKAASFASNQAFEITKLGKITLGTGKITLVPSKTVISGKVFGKADFERVKIKIEVGVGSAEHKDTASTHFAGVSPSFDVTHILRSDLSLSYGLRFENLGTELPGAYWVGRARTKFSFTGTGAASGLSLSVGGDLAYDRFGMRTAGADLTGAYGNRLGDELPYKIGLTGSYDHMLRPKDPLVNPQSKSAHEFQVIVSLTVGIPGT